MTSHYVSWKFEVEKNCEHCSKLFTSQAFLNAKVCASCWQNFIEKEKASHKMELIKLAGKRKSFSYKDCRDIFNKRGKL